MTDSIEYLAFQEAYYDLSQAISHPEQLGGLLWSKRFITHMEKKDAMEESSKSYTRTTVLLDAIRRKIELQPEKLKEFVTILKQDSSFQHLVTILDPSHSEPQATPQASSQAQSACQSRPTSHLKGPRIDTTRMTEQELKKWLPNKGLSEKDLRLLVDEGFATGPAFMLLDEDDVNGMNFTAGGKKLLKKLISSSFDVTPMDTTSSVNTRASTVPIQTTPTHTLLRSDSVSTADNLCSEIGLAPYTLDTEFPDEYSVILAFAKLIPDWKCFANGLKLSPQDIRGIETDSGLDILMRVTQTLQLWKNRFGFKAQYRALVDVALDHRHEKLAKKFCEILQKMVIGAPQDSVVVATCQPVIEEITIDTLLTALESLTFSKSTHGQLSRALSISDAKLTEFEANNVSDIRQVRTDILKEWLRQSDQLSWKTIATAVGKAGDRNLSRKLMTYRIPDGTG